MRTGVRWWGFERGMVFHLVRMMLGKKFSGAVFG